MTFAFLRSQHQEVLRSRERSIKQPPEVEVLGVFDRLKCRNPDLVPVIPRAGRKLD